MKEGRKEKRRKEGKTNKGRKCEHTCRHTGTRNNTHTANGVTYSAKRAASIPVGIAGGACHATTGRVCGRPSSSSAGIPTSPPETTPDGGFVACLRTTTSWMFPFVFKVTTNLSMYLFYIIHTNQSSWTFLERIKMYRCAFLP